MPRTSPSSKPPRPFKPACRAEGLPPPHVTTSPFGPLSSGLCTGTGDFEKREVWKAAQQEDKIYLGTAKQPCKTISGRSVGLRYGGVVGAPRCNMRRSRTLNNGLPLPPTCTCRSTPVASILTKIFLKMRILENHQNLIFVTNL